MKQTDKELLLKDLGARLPYGVMLNVEDFCDKYNDKLFCLSLNYGNSLYINGLFAGNNAYDSHVIIKPYLFPLSSMTKDDIKSLFATVYNDAKIEVNPTEDENLYEIVVSIGCCTKYFYSDTLLDEIDYIGYDWLNAHHYDYRGLIPMGLAIDCTNLNIY